MEKDQAYYNKLRESIVQEIVVLANENKYDSPRHIYLCQQLEKIHKEDKALMPQIRKKWYSRKEKYIKGKDNEKTDNTNIDDTPASISEHI